MEVQQEEEEPIKARKKAVKRKDVYSPSQVADELNITRRTVYTWITEGKIPAFKIGVKLWGVRAHVVDALKEGRDVWRAENGFKAASLQKGVTKDDWNKSDREAKERIEKQNFLARIEREQEMRITSAGRRFPQNIPSLPTAAAVPVKAYVPNAAASPSSPLAPMKNAGKPKAEKGRRH